MSQNLTQPEEIDLFISEMAMLDLQTAAQVADNRQVKTTHARSYAGYISPYRAAYMRDHDIEP